MTNHRLGLALRGLLFAGALSWAPAWMGCGALLPEGSATSAAAESTAPAGPTGYDAQPTVRLDGVVAGVVGTGVLVENHSREALTNVEIVVNPYEPGGGYRFRTERVPAEATKSYMAQVFRNPAGESLNPMVTKVESMAVFADTARGRGSWQGSYTNQH